jgi:hypothetical protein
MVAPTDASSRVAIATNVHNNRIPPALPIAKSTRRRVLKKKKKDKEEQHSNVVQMIDSVWKETGTVQIETVSTDCRKPSSKKGKQKGKGSGKSSSSELPLCPEYVISSSSTTTAPLSTVLSCADVALGSFSVPTDTNVIAGRLKLILSVDPTLTVTDQILVAARVQDWLQHYVAVALSSCDDMGMTTLTSDATVRAVLFDEQTGYDGASK